MFNEPSKKDFTYTVSMRPDANFYIEPEIPAVSYGFPIGWTDGGAAYDINGCRVGIKDMIDAANIYALLMLEIRNRLHLGK
jgi:hypothetical protein